MIETCVGSFGCSVSILQFGQMCSCLSYTSIVQDDLPKINSEKRTKEIRSNDLKLREQKLRKREELNIHEKLNEEMENARIWLQTYFIVIF
jgi:aspartyl/asparaginyl beta-hydroxylase (cupin superfamily)